MLKVNNISFRSNFASALISCRNCSHMQETAHQPVYPPILDLSPLGKDLRKKEAWHTEIQNIKTVEEKLIKINMPKYYGFKCLMINHNRVPYNALPLAQHYTRTHFIQQEDLHVFYKQNEEKVNRYASTIKDEIQEAIVFAFKGYNKKDAVLENGVQKESVVEDQVSKSVICHINRIILNHLSSEEKHLFEGDVDIEPRLEAYWSVGGVAPEERLRKLRKSLDRLKHEDGCYTDRHIQYIGKPAMTLRSVHPLEAVVSDGSITKECFPVPVFHYDARVLGYQQKHRHATNIPGFWPGDKQEFGLLSFYTRGHMLDQPKSYNTEENQNSLNTQGIIHSFAWLLAQANYQGFNTFNELTYPLTTQTIITNGQQFSFYTYQMNTTLIHGENYVNNDRVNVCWGTKEMNLFDEIDDSGNIVNLNEKVLKNLIQFYINQPKDRGINLKPYLDHTKPHIADIDEEERRIWLEQKFKHLVSNRPRHLLPYEVYHWEKIYKIDHKTRPMERKLRPFELGINPYSRRLDEHTPEYIPKCLRPGGPKSKPKWAKTYYP